MNYADRSSPLPFVFLFFLLSSARSTSHQAATKLHGSYKGCFSKVYAFGGSETDTGNAQFLGILPDDTSARGVGSFTSRLTDGRLVVDFLCEALSLPLLSPYKRPSADTSHGLNFAVAGSTSLSDKDGMQRERCTFTLLQGRHGKITFLDRRHGSLRLY